MGTYETTDIRKGLKVDLDGAPYEVAEFQFVKPGKGVSFTRLTLRPLLTGDVILMNLRSSDKLFEADWEELELPYVGEDGGLYRFVHAEIELHESLDAALVETAKPLLFPGVVVTICKYNRQVVRVTLPAFIEATVVAVGEVAETYPRTSAATLANGTIVTVPLGVEVGDVIRVETVGGTYVSP